MEPALCQESEVCEVSGFAFCNVEYMWRGKELRTVTPAQAINCPYGPVYDPIKH